jgi:tellurite methyltransferase
MDERERWNARYTARAGLVAGEPNPFLREHLALLPRGHVLELAMGEGHNAIFLAQQGFSVTGIDISEIAVARALQLAGRAGVSVDARVMDLRTAPLPPRTYDVVICFYYLQRDLFPDIVSTLKPGGMVVYETFTKEQARYGHPTNLAYLLEPNELLEAFKTLRIRLYRDLIVAGPKAVAAVIGEKNRSG